MLKPYLLKNLCSSKWIIRFLNTFFGRAGGGRVKCSPGVHHPSDLFLAVSTILRVWAVCWLPPPPRPPRLQPEGARGSRGWLRFPPGSPCPPYPPSRRRRSCRSRTRRSRRRRRSPTPAPTRSATANVKVSGRNQVAQPRDLLTFCVNSHFMW